MIKFNFIPREPRYVFLTAETTEDYKNLTLLDKHLNKVYPYCFLPNYTGPQIKEEFLYFQLNSKGKRVYYCSIGLWQEVYKFFKKRAVPFCNLVTETSESMLKRPMCTLDEFKAIVDSWGLKFTPREYQYEAAWKILSWKQSLSEIATRAGKTLIAYLVFRYMLEKEGARNILMIVPSVNLVLQGHDDFTEYGKFFKDECIWAGGDEVRGSNLTVGTFQSLIKKLERRGTKYDPKFFDKYDVVFIDEVHRGTASQIKQIISEPFFRKAKLVFGMTGTLPKENTIERFTLASFMGAKIQDITARELMDNDYISPIEITQIRLCYANDAKLKEIYTNAAEYLVSDYDIEPGTKSKKCKRDEPRFLYKYKKTLPPGVVLAKNKMKNPDEYLKYLRELIKVSDSTNNLVLERMVVHDAESRVTYLTELLKGFENDTGNWLILAHHTEYIVHVYKHIKALFPDKRVLKITGSVTVKKRQKIIEEMKDGNAILVASYGCMSTGITLPNLHYGVLFESFMSNVVNVQSLGRGLGKSEDKSVYKVWDFVDVLPTKKIYNQGKEREKIYQKQQYPYTIKTVKCFV